MKISAAIFCIALFSKAFCVEIKYYSSDIENTWEYTVNKVIDSVSFKKEISLTKRFKLLSQLDTNNFEYVVQDSGTIEISVNDNVSYLDTVLNDTISCVNIYQYDLNECKPYFLSHNKTTDNTLHLLYNKSLDTAITSLSISDTITYLNEKLHIFKVLYFSKLKSDIYLDSKYLETIGLICSIFHNIDSTHSISVEIRLRNYNGQMIGDELNLCKPSMVTELNVTQFIPHFGADYDILGRKRWNTNKPKWLMLF